MTSQSFWQLRIPHTARPMQQRRCRQGTCAAESGLAVHRHAASLAFTDVQEPQHYLIGGAAAIREVQLVVLEAAITEGLALVELQDALIASSVVGSIDHMFPHTSKSNI